MLLRSNKQLNELIVNLLARKPSVKAEWIYNKLNSLGYNYSIRAVFKELKSLQKANVILKVGSDYSIRLAWVHELLNFGESILESYKKNALFYTILEEENPKISWKFTDVKKLDEFWQQITLALYEHTGKSKMFYWIKHPWFHYLNPDQEERWQKNMYERNYQLYMIIGRDTPLARDNAKTWHKNVYLYSLASSSFDEESVGSLTVVGDYILTVKLDAKTNAKINRLYYEVKDPEKFKENKIQIILQTKGKHSIKVERKPRKANLFKNRFSRYFGVDRGEF